MVSSSPSVSLKRIGSLARIEWARLLRSRMTFTLLVMVPIMQVLLFGYALRPDAAHTHIAVSGSGTAAIRSVKALIAEESSFILVPGSEAPGTAERLVRQGRAMMGIELPAPQRLAEATPHPIRIVVDAHNPSLVRAALAKAEALYWRALVERAGLEETAPGLVIDRLYNPQGRTDWTFIPGLAGVTMMISMIMLGCLSLAREREMGTWEVLCSFPIQRTEIMIGKLLPYTLLGVLQGVSVLLLSRVLFDLPFRGSGAALGCLLLIFAWAHALIGYAISLRASTQLAALQGAVAFYLPAMLLSGFLYPFEALPVWAQRLGACFPLTHFIEAAQGALLRGEDFMTVLRFGGPIMLILSAVVAIILLGPQKKL